MDEYVGAVRRTFRSYTDLFATPAILRLLDAVVADDASSLLRLPHTALVGEDRSMCPELLCALVGVAGPSCRTPLGAHLDMRALDPSSALAAVVALQGECEFPHFRNGYHVVSLILPSCPAASVIARVRQMTEIGYARLFVSAPPEVPLELFSSFTVLRGVVPREPVVREALGRFVEDRGMDADPEWLDALAAGCDRCLHAALIWLRAGVRAPREPVAELCEEILSRDAREWDVAALTSFAARAAGRGVAVSHLALGLLAQPARLSVPPAEVAALAADLDAQTSRMARASMRNVHYHMERFVAFVVGFGKALPPAARRGRGRPRRVAPV